MLTYIQRARPSTVMQIARALDMDRAQVYRILNAAYGPNFRSYWHESEKTGCDDTRIAKMA